MTYQNMHKEFLKIVTNITKYTLYIINVGDVLEQYGKYSTFNIGKHVFKSFFTPLIGFIFIENLLRRINKLRLE